MHPGLHSPLLTIDHRTGAGHCVAMSAYPPGRPPSGSPHGHEPHRQRPLDGGGEPSAGPSPGGWAGPRAGEAWPQQWSPDAQQQGPDGRHWDPASQQWSADAQQQGPDGRQWNPAPQQWSHGAHGSPLHDAPPSTRRGRLTAIALVALVVGAAVGVGGGWLVLGGTSAEAADPSPAQADAEHACEVAHRLPATIDLGSFGAMDEDPSIHLVTSLNELGTAAALVDPTYAGLQTHGAAMREGMLIFDNDGATRAMTDLRAECDRLGLTEGAS